MGTQRTMFKRNERRESFHQIDLSDNEDNSHSENSQLDAIHEEKETMPNSDTIEEKLEQLEADLTKRMAQIRRDVNKVNEECQTQRDLLSDIRNHFIKRLDLETDLIIHLEEKYTK